MRILQINATCGSGSTGKICQAISQILFDSDVDNRIAYSLGKSDYQYAYKFSDEKNIKKTSLSEHIKGMWGFDSQKSTIKLIEYIEDYDPDIIHLHNIHSHDVNVEMLFNWIREHKLKVIWTFHDCWAYTGYCMYYDFVKCDKWKTRCNKCPQRKKFSFFRDHSEQMQLRKQKLLDGVDLTIVTPSKWLAEQVKLSYLAKYPVYVINNGIDLNVFKSTESEFRNHYGLENKYILLGVASEWEKRKGIDVFIMLAKLLDSRFQIVLVGTNDYVDKKIPDNVISIHRTQNQKQLAEIYSAADLFINPTREDNYPTVNMEAISCGTPVITFRTGGSPEILDEKTGIVVDKDDINLLMEKIEEICESSKLKKQDCINRAKNFDEKILFNKYLNLYNQIQK